MRVRLPYLPTRHLPPTACLLPFHTFTCRTTPHRAARILTTAHRTLPHTRSTTATYPLPDGLPALFSVLLLTCRPDAGSLYLTWVVTVVLCSWIDCAITRILPPTPLRCILPCWLAVRVQAT